jgi:hypothetical protein
MDKTDTTKELNCKPSTADNGYVIETGSPLNERGFLMRYCLKPKVGLPVPQKEDFMHNYRVNIIAMPNSYWEKFNKHWANVFWFDFSRDD